MPRERCRLGGNPLLQVAVGDDGEDAVINDGVPWAVELFSESALRNRHADTIREALAEWAGGCFNASGQSELWVPWRE